MRLKGKKMKFEHCTPTKIHKELTRQAVTDYGCSATLASTLIKRALQQPAVQAAILDHVGDALADAASATVTDATVN